MMKGELFRYLCNNANKMIFFITPKLINKQKLGSDTSLSCILELLHTFEGQQFTYTSSEEKRY